MTIVMTYGSLLGAIVCLALAFFVVFRNARGYANLSLFAALCLLAVVQLSGFMSSQILPYATSLFWTRITIMAEIFLPVPLLIFSLTFARVGGEAFKRYKLVVLALLAATIAFFLIFIFRPALFASTPSVYSELLMLGRVGYFYFIIFFLTIIFVIINLEHTLRASAGVSRWKIKYLIIGLGIISAFYLYYTSHTLFYRVIDPALMPVKGTVTLIACLLMGLSLVRNRLLDINVVVSRYIIYNSVSLFVVAAYLLAMGIIAEGIKRFGGDFVQYLYLLFIFVAIAGLVVLLMSDKLRRSLKVSIDKHFYRDKYDYRAQWLKLTQRLSSIDNIAGLHMAILESLRDTGGSNNATLWLYDIEDNIFSPVETYGVTLKKGYMITGQEGLVAQLRDKEWIVNLKEFGSSGKDNNVGHENAVIFDEIKAALLVPLKSGEEFLGFVALGERIVGDVYNYEDYDILKTMARQAASSILNLKQSEELAHSREMDAFNKISSFIMHDLKNLTHTLSLVAQNAAVNMDNPEFREDAISTIDDTVTKMKKLMARLSTMPKTVEGVELKKKEVDPNLIVQKTIEGFYVNGRRSINLIKELVPLPKILMDPDEIQKVLHNMLINAAEVMEGHGSIRVKTALVTDSINISVEDDGPGMSREFISRSLFKPFMTTKKKGIGIGLFQSKVIVEAHKGTIEVESEEGKGAVFTVVLPCI
ncbi:Sensory transduction histidine kinases [hydrothermal vent metagenome]|uniref:Sensory transduction histidine kinases n=1 Tax=hydrothermal vent metagenome TaxID=652676 RepID=A0A3B0R1V7_9ZZZZ